MPIYRRLALLAVAMGWIVSGVDARADQDENLRRLRSMPLEHRRALAQNLERFDAMGAADREAIRALDRELARQPDADRARYLAVLRRYHLWLQRLPKDKREAIAAAPPRNGWRSSPSSVPRNTPRRRDAGLPRSSRWSISGICPPSTWRNG